MTEREKIRETCKAAVLCHGDCLDAVDFLHKKGIRMGDVCSECFFHPVDGGLCKKIDVIMKAQEWLKEHREEQLELDF